MGGWWLLSLLNTLKIIELYLFKKKGKKQNSPCPCFHGAYRLALWSPSALRFQDGDDWAPKQTHHILSPPIWQRRGAVRDPAGKGQMASSVLGQFPQGPPEACLPPRARPESLRCARGRAPLGRLLSRLSHLPGGMRGWGQPSSRHVLPNLRGNFLWGFHSSSALGKSWRRAFREEMLPWPCWRVLKTWELSPFARWAPLRVAVN